MIQYKFNPLLPFIKEGYKGNITIDGLFCNGNVKDEFPIQEVLKWQLQKNPQKAEKKQDTYRIPVRKELHFLDSKDDLMVWLGHSSFLIRLNGITLLTDPCLFKMPFFPRYIDLPFDLKLLKNIDYVLISHGHRDHFDVPSLKIIKETNPQAAFLVPLEMGKMLKSLGIYKYQEAGWYQAYSPIKELEISFLPAKHWHRRFLWDTNTVLWGSFFIQSSNTSIYFAGDTGYHSHFQEIGSLISNIHYCLMPIGAYKPSFMMQKAHTSPQEAVQGFHELNGKVFIPMHYGTYDLADEPLSEPEKIIKQMNEKKEIKGKIQFLEALEILKI
jgi:L-ascorbate metabolism protein UlaG (beta-lactamase superfamily)